MGGFDREYLTGIDMGEYFRIESTARDSGCGSMPHIPRIRLKPRPSNVPPSMGLPSHIMSSSIIVLRPIPRLMK